MTADLRSKLAIPHDVVESINAYLVSPQNTVIEPLLKIIAKYGTPEEINAKAAEAGKLENLLGRLEEMNSPYLADLKWLQTQIDEGAFITMEEYRRAHCCTNCDCDVNFDEEYAVTLEISALQYFPWLIDQVKHPITEK